ncbi:MAG: hypothetical protein IJ196_05040 [Prevotella sp.]|nr:hypothetical protein [Prevotella sp.]
MKTLKYFVIGALMIGFAAPAVAQEDHSAVIKQITNVIKSKAPNVESEVKNVVKANKKNADVLTAIGRAYFDVRDLDKAATYADMAVKRDKTYGDAYVLMGDIQVLKDDGGAASSWFEQAIYFDPKNPEGYRRYAQINSKTSPSASIAKLEDLRAQRPDYPVDIIAAEIYHSASKDNPSLIDKAIQYYDKVDKSKMEASNLVNYSLDHFLKGNFEKSLSISEYGNQKFARNAALNRLTFFNHTNLKNYDKALEYADRLFNKSDSAKISSSDYLYYGYAYLGNDQYDNAIEMYTKSLNAEESKESDRIDALKNISTAYQKKGDINNAVATYDKYLKAKPQVTAADMGSLATMWQQHARSLEGDEKVEALGKADAVWAEIAEKFPSVAHVAYNNRARIAVSLDPESAEGKAKPYYEKVAQLLADKTDRSANETKYLVEAYHYLGAYYTIVVNDKEQGDIYWRKMLDIDPENATAKTALGLDE